MIPLKGMYNIGNSHNYQINNVLSKRLLGAKLLQVFIYPDKLFRLKCYLIKEIRNCYVNVQIVDNL